MASLIREMTLENGLIVRFFDHTRLYYGDFYLVKVEIVCVVPLCPDYFDEHAEIEEVRRLLGDPAMYRRTVEQMGVPSTAIATVTEQLIGNFLSHSLPYFSASGFPRKFLMTELARARKKRTLPARITAYHHD
ncbi:hypothetical protein KI811_04800 [Geobacter hydrogenophilus]|uniref:Uncharacterized protein n=1 Tax=Geobacter hydrogenophilus TaxID=40983 RepID=A0A9W6G1B2_9BACT|nr:hypothetical protein [Geobacter hydrogenophilus]MBT0893139.1 hypothetical protein [Geobacter hydrogenophilus]GLI39019.1 hypothetical protein GHYDROH2_25200 [Geobacter hydrogenophilus]